MPREPDPSINEAEFVHRCLRKGVRLDGRAMYDLRPVQLTFGDELGWVECRLGDTRSVPFSLLENWSTKPDRLTDSSLSPAARRVVAQVSAEIVKPLADRPYEGFLNLTTEISPMASAAYEAGRCVPFPLPCAVSSRRPRR